MRVGKHAADDRVADQRQENEPKQRHRLGFPPDGKDETAEQQKKNHRAHGNVDVIDQLEVDLSLLLSRHAVSVNLIRNEFVKIREQYPLLRLDLVSGVKERELLQ